MLGSNQRMASFDERYDLTDEDRKVLASQIKDLTEEDFTAFDQNMTVLLSSKVKTEETEEVVEEVEASVAEEVVESAVENAEVEKETVPVSSPAEEPLLLINIVKLLVLAGIDSKKLKYYGKRKVTPVRDYDEHDVVNLFAFDDAAVN